MECIFTFDNMKYENSETTSNHKFYFHTFSKLKTPYKIIKKLIFRHSLHIQFSYEVYRQGGN
jgi:hypothetical protein